MENCNAADKIPSGKTIRAIGCKLLLYAAHITTWFLCAVWYGMPPVGNLFVHGVYDKRTPLFILVLAILIAKEFLIKRLWIKTTVNVGFVLLFLLFVRYLPGP